VPKIQTNLYKLPAHNTNAESGIEVSI